MPNIDKECEGPGATHYHACACREAHFRKLEAKINLAEDAMERALKNGMTTDGRVILWHGNVAELKQALAELRKA